MKVKHPSNGTITKHIFEWNGILTISPFFLQVQVAGLTSEFLGLTIELKPRRRNKRSVLYDLTPEYNKATGQAQGSWSRLEARHIHMLLQNELFINVATAHSQEGELRGQIRALLYSGLEAPREGKDGWMQWREKGRGGREVMKVIKYMKINGIAF